MANRTTKMLTDQDGDQAIKYAFNDVDATITTNGFLVGEVGRKVTLVISQTNVANDTETYTFSENGVQLYQLQLIYTDGSRSTLLSATRIS